MNKVGIHKNSIIETKKKRNGSTHLMMSSNQNPNNIATSKERVADANNTMTLLGKGASNQIDLTGYG